MFKVIGTVLALLIGSSSIFSKGIDFKSIKADIFDEFSLRLRKPVALVLFGLCSILFFCGGSFMAILDATLQYDRTGSITHSSTLWTGVGLAVVFLGSYLYVFMRAWPGAKKAAAKTDTKQEQSPSDLEHAIAMLLKDFVDARKFRRAERRQQETAKEFYSSQEDKYSRGDSAPH